VVNNGDDGCAPPPASLLHRTWIALPAPWDHGVSHHHRASRSGSHWCFSGSSTRALSGHFSSCQSRHGNTSFPPSLSSFSIAIHSNNNPFLDVIPPCNILSIAYQVLFRERPLVCLQSLPNKQEVLACALCHAFAAPPLTQLQVCVYD